MHTFVFGEKNFGGQPNMSKEIEVHRRPPSARTFVQREEWKAMRCGKMGREASRLPERRPATAHGAHRPLLMIGVSDGSHCVMTWLILRSFLA